LDIHRDEDRLNYPLKRLNRRPDAPGKFAKIGWDEAVREISELLQEIIRKYGGSALGAFIGNPVAFNSLLSPAIASFCLQTGCKRVFSSGTQDCSNKFAGGQAVYGTYTLHPIPDIENTQYLLIIGENGKTADGAAKGRQDSLCQSPQNRIRRRHRGSHTDQTGYRSLFSCGVAL
jgi:anaerobic selenocysteine-containing dehydrogenase